MKKIFISLVTLLLSIHAMADCRSILEKRMEQLKNRNSQTNQNLGTGVVLGGILVFANAPLGITLIGASAVGSGLHEISKINNRKLKAAIDEAYVYHQTGIEGKKLQKLLRKINRKLKIDITMTELVDSVVDANESKTICQARNMNHFARKVALELE